MKDFKNKLIASMNKGGWGKENFADAITLINEHIEQLKLCEVSQQRELLKFLINRDYLEGDKEWIEQLLAEYNFEKLL